MIGKNFKPKNVNDVFTLLEVISNADDAKKYLADILVATEESEKAASISLAEHKNAVAELEKLGVEKAQNSSLINHNERLINDLSMKQAKLDNELDQFASEKSHYFNSVKDEKALLDESYKNLALKEDKARDVGAKAETKMIEAQSLISEYDGKLSALKKITG